MCVARLDIFVQRTLEGKSDTEVVVETYCQKNDERLREINRVPHKIMRKGEHWQSAIRKILAEMFVVDEEDTKLVSFNQKMEKPVNSDLLPGLKCAQHNLKAFVTVQGLPPTSKFHTVRQIADGGGGSTVHHYFEWMDIHSYFVKVKNSLKSRRIDHGDSSDEGVKIENNIQVDPFGTALADEQGFPLSPNDPRRILVEQLVQNMYEGTDTLFYSVLSQIDSLNCLLQVQLFDGVGLSKETTLCKIGTAANIAMECKTFDKLDAFCPENVPVRLNEGKPVIMDSMGGIQLKLAVTNWVEYKTSDGAAKVDLVSTLGDVIAWEAERRVEQQHATEGSYPLPSPPHPLPPLLTHVHASVKQEDDETSDSESTDEEDGIWAKDFELDDYFSMENLNNTADVRPFGDAMKVIAEVFGEILAQLSMTTASQDPTCDLVEDYQIRPLLKSVIIDKNRGDGSWPQVTRNDKEFVIRFYARIADAQKIPSQVPYYSEGPVIGPTPENFHGDSILLDSNAKLWFAGDTGKFIERGHVLSAICKFEVLLILDYLKLPVTIDDMNKATGANQIADWLTVSGDVALAIIHTRERGGKFASKEDLLARVSAANLTAVKAKVQELLVEPEERDEQLKQAAMFTNGLLCWHDLRKTARFKDVYSPRMELVWEMVTLLRRKLLLYCKTKTYSSVHHKTGLLSFFLRACSSSKKSSSQRQCAYNAVLQLSRVMLPEFFVQARLGMRHKSEFWDSTNATQRALSEEEFQMELVHYKIDCASKYSHVVDSFRHRSLEVMRHNVSLKPMSDFERGELSILHSEVSGRKIKDQLYATTQLRHWATSDNVEDEGITMLLGELFFNMQQQQNIDSPTSTRKAPKLLILGPSKSGKTVLCHKLMIRILASKQIKRDYKIVPVYISVNRLVMNYSKELEDAGSSLEESLRKMQGGGDKSKVAEGGEESEGGLRSRLNSTTSATSDAPDDSDVPEVDLIDAHFHQECSRFSRRYQALKRLQNSFKLLFIFDGMDEAGPMRDMIEQYVDDKLRSRHQMVIVTSKQPALNPSFFALYKWCGILPLSQNQQLDYAKRKLDFQNMPNHYQMLKNIDKVLSDKNFAKLATCPLMLSMMISLLDSSGTKTVAQLAPTPVVEPTTPKNGKKGGKKADEKVVAAPLPIVGADSGNKLPFHDKPSMFHLAIKMAVGHLDIANTSSTNQTADSKIDPNVTIHFLQKLAWFCHSNYTVDITSSKVVELLQMTSGGAASTDKSSLESALFRQVWNHLTGVIRTSNNKFEILVSTSYLSKFVGGKITSESVYQFSHSSFQEYLCAMELLERLQAEVDNNVTGVEACKRIFLQNPEIRGGAILHNFWWMNVVYFAASAAPTWLFRDMTKFLLMNDDDSASNATLCFELGRLRGDMVQIPRFRATQRLAACLSHHCVRVRRCALAEIQINSSYKIDVISSIVKLLDDDLTAAKNGKSKEQLHWYEKIAAVNSMVSLDAALYCVGSNRTMHQKIVELLSAMLASAEESETVKSLVLESIRSMGLQHEPQVRKTLVSMLKKKGMHSIRVLIRMISKMNVVDAHLLAIIASDLNDPPLRQDCEEALIELVSNSVWNVSTGAPSQTPMGSSMAAQTSIGNLAMATGGASFARGRKRGNIVVAQSFLPNEVMSLLFQIMALPNGDEARASASRVLGKCNVHDQLIPLFMMWMKKRTDSVVPCKTAADLEFPSLEMVSMLSLSFPVEKLLDWTNSEEKSFLLMEQCLDMMDCLIHGGANIGEMLSEENMVETGQILPKMLRCLNAADYETLQCRSVDALNACHLTQWEGVVEALLDVFIKDAKVAVKHKIADVLFHSSTERAVQMEGLYALKMWIRHRDLDMKLSCLDKIVELKLCNKTNIIVIGEYLKELFVDENAVVRARSLECMIAGDLVGQYLEGELDEFYDIVASLFQYDHDTDVKILAAKCLLEGVATESKSCSEVTQIIGGWAQNLNRFDLYEPAVRACISVPVNYWMNVDMTNSSKFKSFVVTQNLSVQSILKLLDSDVELRKVKLWVMRFVLHIAKEGFSLRLLSSLLDSLNFKRLEEVLASASANDEQSALDLLAISLDVMLAVFVPDQTPISDELVMRIQRLLKIHFDAGIRGRCCDLVLKFNMSTENIVSMITEEDAAWQGVALRSILKKKEFLLEDTELMDVLLSHVARMGSGNLILTLQIMQELDMGMLDDKHLDLIRTMMVALVGRIFLEFDHMHGGREGSHEDAHLSEWCLPAIAVIEKHTFLLSAVSMNHVNAERRRMSEGVENMSLSAQAVAQAEQDSRRKESVAGATTIVASKRLSETLMKLAQHEHAEPTVLKKVCGIFVSSIASGELVWLSGLVDALVKCKEPEMGVIILETLESITIGAEDSVKVLLKTVLGDAQARGFCFKPLIDFLGNLRAQEECEWSLPKSWADLVAKGMKEKVIEMAFLMKELRIGSMVSGGMFKKTTDIKMGGDRNYYTGAVFDPVCVTELYDKVHLEFNDGKDHVNYHDRRKSLLKQQRQVFRHLVVDGEGKVTTAGGGARYATISEALEEAEDGDEIHVYPKKDGGSYKERLVIEKSVVVKGMKNVYGVGGGGRSSSGGGGEGEEPEGGEGRARKESGSILDAVAGEGGKVSTGKALGEMVQSLKDEGAKEEEDLKKREYDAVMKSKGKKVEKKHVLVEFYDVGEEEPVIRCCGKDVKLVNLTVQHKGPDNLACIFVGFGTLTCQQMRLYSEGGDGVYVTQGGALVAKQSCHFGPCKRNGVLVEGLCSGVDVSDCEIRGNKQCGVKVLGGAEVILKRNRINGNDLHGVSIGLKCPADLMQNSFENNKDTHLFINAKWFPKEKDMININNSESDDDYRVASRLNTIKSTKTWSKGRRYSLHGTQAFMDVLGNDDMAA